MSVFHTKIDSAGKIQLPPQILKKLNLEAGQDLTVEVEKNTLRVSLSAAEKVRRAQAIIGKYVNPAISLADELIEDRRREVEND